MDPHVFPVSGCALLYNLVHAVPALCRHHSRAASHLRYHGCELDNHRGASPNLRGALYSPDSSNIKQNLAGLRYKISMLSVMKFELA